MSHESDVPPPLPAVEAPLRREWSDDRPPPATPPGEVELLDAKTRHLDAQTRARAERNRGRQVAGNVVVQVAAAGMWTVAVGVWLGFVIAGADPDVQNAVGGIAIAVTTFATGVLVKNSGGKGGDAAE